MRYAQGGGLTAAGRERRERVRFQAAAWFEAGRGSPWIADRLRVGLRQVEKWRVAWQDGGLEALRSAGSPGRARLTDEQFARLEIELERGPLAHGWDDQRWTLDRIAQLIEDLFAVRYTIKGVSLLMHRHGWSVQAPARRAVEQDEVAAETWVKQVWPQVKHSRPRPDPGWCSRTRPGRA